LDGFGGGAFAAAGRAAGLVTGALNVFGGADFTAGFFAAMIGLLS
jgi:hypothetical protein